MCTETQIQNSRMGMHLHEVPRAIFPIRILNLISSGTQKIKITSTKEKLI